MPRLDFQKIAEEREDFTVVLITGEEVTLPKVVPANTLLKLLAKRSPQALRKMNDDEKNNFGNEMLAAIVGKENWERILDGIGVDNIRPFTQEVYDYYGLGGDAEADAEAEASDRESEAEGKVEEAHAPLNPSQSMKSLTTSEPSTPTLNGSTHVPGESSTKEPSSGESSSPELDISPESPSS